MDLSTYRAPVDCFAKIMTFFGPHGRRVIFQGERNVIPNSMISIITAKKLMRKGCMGYLTYVIDSKKDTDQVSNLLIVREFLEVIPDELL